MCRTNVSKKDCIQKDMQTHTHSQSFCRERINKFLLSRFLFLVHASAYTHFYIHTNTLLFPNPLNELAYVICMFALNTLLSPCVYVFQDAKVHGVFVGVVGGAFCLFLAVFILVCTETLSQRWRTLLGLAVWATHLTMGFTFIFSTGTEIPIQPWDQVTHTS